MKTQPAAPPSVPPRRPIVAVAMPDDDDPARWRYDLTQVLAKLDALCDQLEAQRAANRAALAYLRARWPDA